MFEGARVRMIKLGMLLLVVGIAACTKEKITLDMKRHSIQSDIRIENLVFKSSDTVFAIGGIRNVCGEIHASTDRGVTWRKVFEGEDKMYDIDFCDNRYMIAVGDCTRVQKSYDGGMTWPHEVYIEYFWANDRSSLRRVKVLDFVRVVAIGNEENNRGNSYYSEESGNSWGNKHGMNALEDFWVFNADSTYACGFGILERITNYGKTVKIMDCEGDNYTGIWFTSNSVGYMCGYDGGIYKTTNGGASWETVYKRNSVLVKLDHFTDIVFLDDNVGFAAGEDGLLLTTRDAGCTWLRVKTKTKDCFTGLTTRDGVLYIFSDWGVYYTIEK